ncbi:exported hypothetical protein [Frigoribacterium sp. 9N]|nr:exported hypothetical protein [Frigoribacterium sp. 9N]
MSMKTTRKLVASGVASALLAAGLTFGGASSAQAASKPFYGSPTCGGASTQLKYAPPGVAYWLWHKKGRNFVGQYWVWQARFGYVQAGNTYNFSC